MKEQRGEQNGRENRKQLACMTICPSSRIALLLRVCRSGLAPVARYEELGEIEARDHDRCNADLEPRFAGRVRCLKVARPAADEAQSAQHVALITKIDIVALHA